MPCRHDSTDPLKCEMCGAYLWVGEDSMFCGDCGVVMPCSMVRRPLPSLRAPGGSSDVTAGDRGPRTVRP